MSEYSEKLKNPRWQEKRLEVLKRDKWKCKNCRSNENILHIHHLKYIRGKEPWEVPLHYLITLCENCHRTCTELGMDSIRSGIKTICEVLETIFNEDKNA